ncbi:MAG TPA: PLP-dependent aminotransferase family protein [Streptosporangiaceae bacterium]
MTDTAGRTIGGSHLARLVAVPAGARPYYTALAHAVRDRIRDGRLPLRVRLPAERDLAQALGVSRTTVTAAYDRLRDDGYIDSRRGAGSWTTLPLTGTPESGTDAFWPGADLAPHVIDFGAAAPPAPPELGAAVAAAAEELPRYARGPGYHLGGIEALRAAIAQRYARRGLPTRPDQILVTAGALHGIDLVIALLLGPGDAIATEQPTYVNALRAMRRRNLRIIPVGITGDCPDIELLEAGMRQSAARLAYIIPDFHNPTGLLMSADRRRELVAAIRRVNGYLLVDETYADLPVGDAVPDDALPPPVAAFDGGDRVISVGSASKLFWGGLRIGWIRATPPLIARLIALRSTQDISGPVLDQIVAAELMRDLEPIRARRRAELGTARDNLLAAVRAELPTVACATPPGGLSVWAELDAPVADRLVRVAVRHGVLVTPGPSFGVDGTLDRFVRLPFCLTPDDLTEGVRRLAAAYRELTPGRTPTPTI